MKFKDKLTQLRSEAELSQVALANKAGVPAGTIRNLEQGIRLPTWPTVVKLAKALKVSLGDFDGCEIEERGAGTGRRSPAKKAARPKK